MAATNRSMYVKHQENNFLVIVNLQQVSRRWLSRRSFDVARGTLQKDVSQTTSERGLELRCFLNASQVAFLPTLGAVHL